MISIGWNRLSLILLGKCPLKPQSDKEDAFLVAKSGVPQEREILQMRDTETGDRMIAEVSASLSIHVQIPGESKSMRKELINGEEDMAEELHLHRLYFSSSGRRGLEKLGLPHKT